MVEMAIRYVFVRSCGHFLFPPFAKCARRMGHPLCFCDGEIKTKPTESEKALALLRNLAIIAQSFRRLLGYVWSDYDDSREQIMNSKRVLTGAILVAMLVLPAIAAPPDSKSKSATDRDAAVAEKWIAGWNSHDPDKMLPLFTDDIFYEDVAFGEVSHGRAEVRKFVVAELEGVPDLELKLVRADIHDGHGTIEWMFSGTDKDVFKTGKKFSVRGVSVIEMRDGKISRNVDFYDVATVIRQVRLLPTQ